MKRLGMIGALVCAVSMSVMMIGACGGSATQAGPDAAAQESSIEAYLATAETGGPGDKVPDPNAESVSVVSIYAPKADGSGIEQNMDDVTELNANELLRKLTEYGVLPEGVQSTDMTTEGGKATVTLTELPDTDKQTLACITNTFVENFELDAVTLKVGDEVIAEDIPFDKEYKTLTK